MMKKFIILFFITLFSCDPSFDGIILLNDEKDNIIENAMVKNYPQGIFSGNMMNALSDDVEVFYSTERYKGKEKLVSTWKEDHSYFKNIVVDDFESMTTYNKDKTYTTYTKFNWTATGIYSNDVYSIPCVFNYTWKNDEIVRVNIFFDDLPYINEYRAYYTRDE